MMQEGWMMFLIREGPASGAGRSRVWRGLKALGAAVLRDGVYVLPGGPETYEHLGELQGAVIEDGGSAAVFVIPSDMNAVATSGFRKVEVCICVRERCPRLHAIDRVASAWLIKRRIDERAQFKWLASAADCPEHALGFDFDGAAFTHVGGLVTFEVLLRAFGLDGDAALVRLAAMVHALDAGDGQPSPEAAGFEVVLTGARDTSADDDALIAALFPVLDLLYAGFQREQRPLGIADA